MVSVCITEKQLFRCHPRDIETLRPVFNAIRGEMPGCRPVIIPTTPEI
jgi:hypothetical protein